MKSDKTVLNILENFLDEHAGESAWEDAVKALNAHYLTVAERLIGKNEPTNKYKIKKDAYGATYTDVKGQDTAYRRNQLRAELRTAFRKEYGGENE